MSAATPIAHAPTRQTLRPYQREALDELRSKLRHHRRLLLVAPVGAGKTTIAAEMIHSAIGRGRRVLFLAHRKELIDQCSQRLDQFAVPHGVIMAGHPRAEPSAQVQVASVQTLARRKKPPADLVIIDECHHARARTYEKILAEYESAAVIGLTATPWRTDGKGLGNLFEDLVVAATPQDLVDQGYLVPARGWAFSAPDLSEVRTVAGDFEKGGLELVMGGSAILGNIVQAYLDHASGKRGVLFATSIKHSQELAARFVAAGVAAEHLDGTTPKEEREAILSRLAAGETRIVCNVAVLCEGWDLPALEVCILARPTKSEGLYLQQVGRVLRTAPGKTCALIHDHGGNVERHGLPELERDYSLDSDRKRDKQAIPPMSTCTECLALYLSALRECPECGVQSESAKRREAPEEILHAKAIPLREMSRTPAKARRAEYDRLARTALARGYKIGWAAWQYKNQHGEWPPWRWQLRWKRVAA